MTSPITYLSSSTYSTSLSPQVDLSSSSSSTNSYSSTLSSNPPSITSSPVRSNLSSSSSSTSSYAASLAQTDPSSTSSTSSYATSLAQTDPSSTSSTSSYAASLTQTDSSSTSSTSSAPLPAKSSFATTSKRRPFKEGDRVVKSQLTSVPMCYPQMLERVLSLDDQKKHARVCIIGLSALIPKQLNQRLQNQEQRIDPELERYIYLPQLFEVIHCLPGSTVHVVSNDSEILNLTENSFFQPNPTLVPVYPYGSALETLDEDFVDSDKKKYKKTRQLFGQIVRAATRGNSAKSILISRDKLIFHTMDIAQNALHIGKKKCNFVFAIRILKTLAENLGTKNSEEQRSALQTICKHVFTIVKTGGRVYVDQGSVQKICAGAQITEEAFLQFLHEATEYTYKSKLLTNEPLNDRSVFLPLYTDTSTLRQVAYASETDAIYEFTRKS